MTASASEINWPFEAFPMIISGTIKSGKTHYALDLIETVYLDYFENIIIICPTFYENKTYTRRWLNLDLNVQHTTNPDFLRSINLLSKAYGGTNTLFIIDDLAFTKDMKKNSGDLVKLVFSLRHQGISVWILTQKYNAVVKAFRDNLFMLVTFYMKDNNSMKKVLEENGIKKEDHESIINFLETNERGKLIIRTIHPRAHWLIS